MTIIEQIKAEIERLKSIEYPCDNSQQATGFFNAIDRMTDFLDTLESEKPMQEGVDEEIDRLWESFADEMEGPHNLFDMYARLAHHFAEWGAEHAREQMMKEAVCYIAQPDIVATGNIVIPFIRIGYTALSRYGIKVGDKVRIIIVKED